MIIIIIIISITIIITINIIIITFIIIIIFNIVCCFGGIKSWYTKMPISNKKTKIIVIIALCFAETKSQNILAVEISNPAAPYLSLLPSIEYQSLT